jgi:hypothetical protein
MTPKQDAWHKLVMEVKKKNPNLPLKEVLKLASKQKRK